MSGVTYAFGIVAAVLVLVAIIELMRKGTLRERHAVWWFFGGVSLRHRDLPSGAHLGIEILLGIEFSVNLIFFIAIGLLFLVSLQYGAELTRIEARMRDLSENNLPSPTNGCATSRIVCRPRRAGAWRL